MQDLGESGVSLVEKNARHSRSLLQQSRAANVKLVFFFYKNITADDAHELISGGLRHPDFVSALNATGVGTDVKLFWVADKFPHYDVMSKVDYPVPSLAAPPIFAPGPLLQVSASTGRLQKKRNLALVLAGNLIPKTKLVTGQFHMCTSLDDLHWSGFDPQHCFQHT